MATYVTSRSKSVSNAQATSGGCGCLGCIGTIIVLWALFLGVTYGGTHYELSCSCDQGVVIDETPTE